MPFKKGDSATKQAARMGGLAAGPWRGKNPATVRNKQIRIAVSDSEKAMIERVAAATGTSKTEAIVRAVAAYEADQEDPF
jgi:hypothetical protein